MTHKKKQDRAITRTAGAARLSPGGWPGLGKKRNMMRPLAMPSTRKAVRATRNTRLTWFRRPRALASEMVLDMATGRPAWEIISSRL